MLTVTILYRYNTPAELATLPTVTVLVKDNPAGNALSSETLIPDADPYPPYALKGLILIDWLIVNVPPPLGLLMMFIAGAATGTAGVVVYLLHSFLPALSPVPAVSIVTLPLPFTQMSPNAYAGSALFADEGNGE
jgi:hypothetical protein